MRASTTLILLSTSLSSPGVLGSIFNGVNSHPFPQISTKPNRWLPRRKSDPPPPVVDEPEKPKQPKKSGWFRRKEKQDDLEATKEASKDDDKKQPKKGKQDKKESTEKQEETPPAADEATPEKNEEDKKKKKEAAPTKEEKTVDVDDDDEEDEDEESESHQEQKSQPTTVEPADTQRGSSQNIVVVPRQHSFPPNSMIITRPHSPHHMRPEQQNSSMVLAEVLASLFGTVLRLGFMTWLARRLASQEESLHPTQHFVWERLNDRYERDQAAFRKVLQEPPRGVGRAQWYRKHTRKAHGRVDKPPVDLANVFTRTVVVVELTGKEGISLEQLPDVVTFLLQQHAARAFGVHKENNQPMMLEVVFLVESPGGAVSTFGLAASQMRRLRHIPGITTTVCVDNYAASGGYMIASQAHKLLAAPFATVGSIGVIAQLLNFNELAERHGIKPITIKAGANKNPLSNIDHVSQKTIREEEKRMEKVHEAFRRLVVEGRPALAKNLDEVADGSVFLGQEALDLKLIDGVITSDDYLVERMRQGDRILKLHRSYQARMPRRTYSLSPLDLLPHLQAWYNRLDKAKVRRWLSRGLQASTTLGIAKAVLEHHNLH